MSAQSCWYSLKNALKCSNGGIKYKLSALLYISYLTEIKYYVSMFSWPSLGCMCIHFICIHVSDIHWYQRCWSIFLNFATHWAKMWNTVNLPEPEEKCANSTSNYNFDHLLMKYKKIGTIRFKIPTWSPLMHVSMIRHKMWKPVSVW